MPGVKVMDFVESLGPICVIGVCGTFGYTPTGSFNGQDVDITLNGLDIYIYLHTD